MSDPLCKISPRNTESVSLANKLSNQVSRANKTLAKERKTLVAQYRKPRMTKSEKVWYRANVELWLANKLTASDDAKMMYLHLNKTY